jgi:GR25 family glycosyltransferase involved in LPS biosynthesis
MRFPQRFAGDVRAVVPGFTIAILACPLVGELKENRLAVGYVSDTSSASELWRFFDKAYCISLEEREDRRQEAERQFRAVGLGDRVEFVIVKKDPVDAERGIYESHLACLRRGIQAGARTMLVFEDDIVFDRFDTKVLSDCVRFLSVHYDWKIFFFGCLTSGSRKTANASVLKVRYRSLAHAYAIQHGFAGTLLARPWRRQPYDMLISSLSGEYYAAYPAFAFQSNSRTDNTRRKKLDRWRRRCGGLLRIQKLDELYHRHPVVVIGAHVFLIVILLILVAGH